jgi:hypothetical protein
MERGAFATLGAETYGTQAVKPVPPLQEVARHELRDALHQSERAGNVVETEKTVQTLEANVAAH